MEYMMHVAIEFCVLFMHETDLDLRARLEIHTFNRISCDSKAKYLYSGLPSSVSNMANICFVDNTVVYQVQCQWLNSAIHALDIKAKIHDLL